MVLSRHMFYEQKSDMIWYDMIAAGSLAIEFGRVSENKHKNTKEVYWSSRIWKYLYTYMVFEK